jgi:hypothetical protein
MKQDMRNLMGPYERCVSKMGSLYAGTPPRGHPARGHPPRSENVGGTIRTIIHVTQTEKEKSK